MFYLAVKKCCLYFFLFTTSIIRHMYQYVSFNWVEINSNQSFVPYSHTLSAKCKYIHVSSSLCQSGSIFSNPAPWSIFSTQKWWPSHSFSCTHYTGRSKTYIKIKKTKLADPLYSIIRCPLIFFVCICLLHWFDFHLTLVSPVHCTAIYGRPETVHVCTSKWKQEMGTL